VQIDLDEKSEIDSRRFLSAIDSTHPSGFADTTDDPD